MTAYILTRCCSHLLLFVCFLQVAAMQSCDAAAAGHAIISAAFEGGKAAHSCCAVSQPSQPSKTCSAVRCGCPPTTSFAQPYPASAPPLPVPTLPPRPLCPPCLHGPSGRPHPCLRAPSAHPHPAAHPCLCLLGCLSIHQQSVIMVQTCGCRLCRCVRVIYLCLAKQAGMLTCRTGAILAL